MLVFVAIAGLVFSMTSQSFDSRLALAIYDTNLGGAFTQVAVLSSKYGREHFWIGFVALLFLFGKRDTKVIATELAVLFVVGIIAGDAAKFVAYRSRPFDDINGIVARVPEVADSSFPSGHALVVSLGATFMLVASRGRRRMRTIVVPLLLVEAGLVSYSRVYLGVHYPLDVLAAVFLAGSVVAFGLFFFRGYLARQIQSLVDLEERVLGTLRFPEAI